MKGLCSWKGEKVNFSNETTVRLSMAEDQLLVPIGLLLKTGLENRKTENNYCYSCYTIIVIVVILYCHSNNNYYSCLLNLRIPLYQLTDLNSLKLLKWRNPVLNSWKSSFSREKFFLNQKTFWNWDEIFEDTFFWDEKHFETETKFDCGWDLELAKSCYVFKTLPTVLETIISKKTFFGTAIAIQNSMATCSIRLIFLRDLNLIYVNVSYGSVRWKSTADKVVRSSIKPACTIYNRRFPRFQNLLTVSGAVSGAVSYNLSQNPGDQLPFDLRR